MNKTFTGSESMGNAVPLYKGVMMILLLFTGWLPTEAQQLNPVQITTQLIPPYSVYLSDYATPGNDKLRLIVLQRDLTKPSYKIRLYMTVELNGNVVMRTARSFNPPSIILEPGSPSIISGADLQPYVDSRNIEFVGISRDEYERTKALPEGNYQICFTAYDYSRQDVSVSLPGCNFFWLSKNEPPMVNFPVCGTALPVQTPQQILFSWLPRNTSSQNSAADTEYEFSLYETRPAGRNPNDVVLTSQPIYRTVTDNTQLVYSMAEPLLFENMQYVWRVRAIDKGGKDQFRNNGYSEICTFTYGGVGSNVQLSVIEDLQVSGEAERRGKASWTAQQEVDGYKVWYKKAGSSYQWFSLQSQQPTASIFDLDPETDYEVRVQSYAGPVYGPYSDIRKFKTPAPRVPQCGDSTAVITASSAPLAFATKGMIIDVQGIEMTINEVEGPLGEGLYKGKGEVSIPYFGGAVFNVVFDNLYIDDTRKAIRGRIDFITKSVDEWAQDELAEQHQRELEEQQEENRDQWKDTDFYKDVIYYNDIGIDSMYVNEEGNVIIVGDDGNTYINKDIPTILADAPDKAIIIEDKDGDQWVVQKDGKVTKVPGGGLSPTYNIEVSQEALNLVKSALISLRNDYNDGTLQNLKTAYDTDHALLNDYIKNHNEQIMGADTNTTTDEAQPLFFDFLVYDEAAVITDASFNDLSTKARQREMEYNRGHLLNILGNADNIADSPDLVAREVIIEGQTATEYLTAARQSGKTEEEIITTLKKAIIILIDKVLITVSQDIAAESISNQE